MTAIIPVSSIPGTAIRYAVAPIPSAIACGRDAAIATLKTRMLQSLAPGHTLTRRADGCPQLIPGDLYVSITHSRHRLAMAVAPHPLGIDLEEPRPQLARVAPRFLTGAERAFFPTLDDLCRAWQAKEAVFKAHSCGQPATPAGATTPTAPPLTLSAITLAPAAGGALTAIVAGRRYTILETPDALTVAY